MDNRDQLWKEMDYDMEARRFLHIRAINHHKTFDDKGNLKISKNVYPIV